LIKTLEITAFNETRYIYTSRQIILQVKPGFQNGNRLAKGPRKTRNGKMWETRSRSKMQNKIGIGIGINDRARDQHQDQG
jgi:hypothetical protein